MIPLDFFTFFDSLYQTMRGLFIKKDPGTLIFIITIMADDGFQNPTSTIGDYRFTETLCFNRNNPKIFFSGKNQKLLALCSLLKQNR